ncbi:UDP-3-O-(3-hydroxymyristoyl)glucosamine N-acyltransferase [Vibrio tapetis subsp. quintayensis]|uniref:UDP-3-O-(3-hydroxymyristoyl)glucosamine N-acyltransferase n=1 Tax=Vibrio tapetis TaxID=52443 RepID=UPI0025B3D3D2|nr:UDP-3-O-(3-hydroxymyristoyl)glucosamine N-acyltransferase [Vibrio tapetis]MDN3679484.1 UDP-3-O-(3-hydroxymyristoyl)glucosamine N-acyltransferase [Vibrio tapetis subsp. quintayensis]
MNNTFSHPLLVSDICKLLDKCEHFGKDFEVTSISDISEPLEHSLCEYTKGDLPESQEGYVLLTQKKVDGYNCIVVENSKKCLVKLIKALEFKKNRSLLSPTALIGENCTIDDGVIIGERTIVESGVVIRGGTKIGTDCIIRANATIGSEGYSFYYDNEYYAIPSLGGVIIGDGVEIGSGCNISKGNFNNTVIGKGSKLDALNHIAHDCMIGERCTITASVALCGYVKVGSNTRIAPNASILQRKIVGNNAVIGLGAVVVSNVPDGSSYFGNPARKVLKM